MTDPDLSHIVPRAQVSMISAASIDRRCRLVELDPRYCDVIRRRWTKWAIARGLDVGTGGLDS